MRSLISIEDLSDEEIESILERAAEFHSSPSAASVGRNVLGLVFFEPSLRTRAGFAAAAARLGWDVVDVSERRVSRVSQAENWADTLRVVSGYVDVVVARAGSPLSSTSVRHVGCALINGGDAGPDAEHPTQALVDTFAMRQILGPVTELSIAIVGDPRMRAARSLMTLLARMQPRSVTILADSDHLTDAKIPKKPDWLPASSWDQLGSCDVVYVAGIPHRALPLSRREPLLATLDHVAMLSDDCVLMSPMPVIDEMDSHVRASQRNRMFEQSDLGLPVRMAVLEFATRPLA